MIIGEDRKREILHECHSSTLAAHPGTRNTRLRVQERYHWIGIEKDVDEWVRGSCKEVFKQSSATFSCLIAFHLHGITPFLNV